MKDEIYWGNLKGILQKGRWSLNLEEASALLAVYQETDKRSNPEKLEVKETEPIKKPTRKKKP